MEIVVPDMTQMDDKEVDETLVEFMWARSEHERLADAHRAKVRELIYRISDIDKVIAAIREEMKWRRTG